MSFLVWDNEQDAVDSLDAINDTYECPYEDAGYKMDTWDIIAPSREIPTFPPEPFEMEWGFYSPEARLGYTEGQMMYQLTSGYETYPGEKPDRFYPEDFTDQ